MWTFNVVREILRRASYTVFPDRVPQSDEDMLETATRGLSDWDPKRRWVVKIHSLVRDDIPRSAFITTLRDVRDALISWMRFMRTDFDTALRAAVDMTHTYDHYAAFPQNRLLVVPYTEISRNPVALIRRTSGLLSLGLTDHDLVETARRFSKRSVTQIIENTEKSIQSRAVNGGVTKDELVRNADGSIRGFDTATGFQSGHTSNYIDGQWAGLLSTEQRRKMNDALGAWLINHGFPMSD